MDDLPNSRRSTSPPDHDAKVYFCGICRANDLHLSYRYDWYGQIYKHIRFAHRGVKFEERRKFVKHKDAEMNEKKSDARRPLITKLNDPDICPQELSARGITSSVARHDLRAPSTTSGISPVSAPLARKRGRNSDSDIDVDIGSLTPDSQLLLTKTSIACQLAAPVCKIPRRSSDQLNEELPSQTTARPAFQVHDNTCIEPAIITEGKKASPATGVSRENVRSDRNKQGSESPAFSMTNSLASNVHEWQKNSSQEPRHKRSRNLGANLMSTASATLSSEASSQLCRDKRNTASLATDPSARSNSSAALDLLEPVVSTRRDSSQSSRSSSPLSTSADDHIRSVSAIGHPPSNKGSVQNKANPTYGPKFLQSQHGIRKRAQQRSSLSPATALATQTRATSSYSDSMYVCMSQIVKPSTMSTAKAMTLVNTTSSMQSDVSTSRRAGTKKSQSSYLEPTSNSEATMSERRSQQNTVENMIRKTDANALASIGDDNDTYHLALASPEITQSEKGSRKNNTDTVQPGASRNDRPNTVSTTDSERKAQVDQYLRNIEFLMPMIVSRVRRNVEPNYDDEINDCRMAYPHLKVPNELLFVAMRAAQATAIDQYRQGLKDGKASLIRNSGQNQSS